MAPPGDCHVSSGCEVVVYHASYGDDTFTFQHAAMAPASRGIVRIWRNAQRGIAWFPIHLEPVDHPHGRWPTKALDIACSGEASQTIGSLSTVCRHSSRLGRTYKRDRDFSLEYEVMLNTYGVPQGLALRVRSKSSPPPKAFSRLEFYVGPADWPFLSEGSLTQVGAEVTRWCSILLRGSRAAGEGPLGLQPGMDADPDRRPTSLCRPQAQKGR